MKSAIVCGLLSVVCLGLVGCGSSGRSENDVVIKGTTWGGDGKVVETREWRMYAEPRDANAQINIQIVPPERQQPVNQVSAPAKKSSWWGWGGDDEAVKVTTTVHE